MGTLSTFASLGYEILKSNVTNRRIPIFLSLYITNRCNIRCKYCFVVDESFSKEFLREQMSREEVFALVDEFYAMGTRMIWILGGEPLVHQHIGEIIDYIVAKGIYLQVVTNGLMIQRRLQEIGNVHGLCVSLDGLGEANDVIRGEGVFEGAVTGIRTAVAAGIPTRIHAVLTRNNLHQMRSLAELCRELKVEMTLSPPNFLGETDAPYLRVSREEYQGFWRDYLAMYKEGLPIGNSSLAIKKCAEWPVDYHRYIRRGERFPDYKPVFCLNGYTYVAVGADGTMYNCINLGCTHGPNIREMGIKAAWERLLEWRPDCVSCSSINCIETALLLKMRLDLVRGGLKFHRMLVG